MSKQAKALDTLEQEIDELESGIVDAERKAGDLIGDEIASQIADAEATIMKLRLGLRYKSYFHLARATRSTECRTHGFAILVSCPECAERNPNIREHHDAYLAAVKANYASEPALVHDMKGTIAAVEVGRTQGIEPRTTLRILAASKRST